jgi:ankyrin repeat protein
VIEPHYHRKEIVKFIEDGYYIFANYALVYWTDHLTTVVAFENSVIDSDKHMLLQDIQQLLSTQYDHRYTKNKLSTDKIKTEFSLWNQEAFFEQLIEAITVHRLRRRSDQELMRAHKNLPLIRSNMRMEENFLEIRREIRQTRNLAKKYGNNLYYCSRLDCNRFSEGFSDSILHRDHENKHDTMKCPVEGCIATFRGPGMYNSMDRHIKHIHDHNHDTFHPIGQPQTLSSMLKELIQFVDIHGLEETLSKAKNDYNGTVIPYKLFQTDRYSSDWASKQAWKLAVANPVEELLQVLIKYTCFENTCAQGWILEHATHAGDQSLVERFTDSKYDNGRKDRFHPAWDRAIKAAIMNGHAEILDVLLDRAMLNDRERPSKEKIRDLCIIAARVGHLPCVELLITKHDANPYHAKRGVTMNEEPGLPSFGLEKEKYRHSAFYHAVLNGDSKMLRYLTERASDEQLASLFRKESREDLILLAAANGYEEIISILDAQSIKRQFIDDVLLRARFYNAIRQGSRTKADEMVDQASAMKEIPDRDGCTLLMHAAFHGFDNVVRALLKCGADILRGTYRYGDVQFYPKKHAGEIALEMGHLKVAQILVSFMNDKMREMKKRKEEEEISRKKQKLSS